MSIPIISPLCGNLPTIPCGSARRGLFSDRPTADKTGIQIGGGIFPCQERRDLRVIGGWGFITGRRRSYLTVASLPPDPDPEGRGHLGRNGGLLYREAAAMCHANMEES